MPSFTSYAVSLLAAVGTLVSAAPSPEPVPNRRPDFTPCPFRLQIHHGSGRNPSIQVATWLHDIGGPLGASNSEESSTQWTLDGSGRLRVYNDATGRYALRISDRRATGVPGYNGLIAQPLGQRAQWTPVYCGRVWDRSFNSWRLDCGTTIVACDYDGDGTDFFYQTRSYSRRSCKKPARFQIKPFDDGNCNIDYWDAPRRGGYNGGRY